MNKAQFKIEGTTVLGTIEDNSSVLLTIELEKEDFDAEQALCHIVATERERLDWLLDNATAGKHTWGRLAKALYLIDVTLDIVSRGAYNVVAR
jgi:hypothetical protein